jgi:PLP dependent protein
MTNIADNYARVLDRMAEAAQKAGRNAADITLIAVTKTWPVETLLAAYEAGMRHFGENRTAEIAAKRPLLEAELGRENGITWHYIADLQSRQTAVVADTADFLHALDRLKIGQRLAGRLAENGRAPLPVLLQANVSGEESKAGLDCHTWEQDSGQRERLQQTAEAIAQLPELQLCGLMTMAPWEAPEGEIRQVFGRARALRDWLQTAVPTLALPVLSMGMTDDYELAILEGATHVRVGRALFGERH